MPALLRSPFLAALALVLALALAACAPSGGGTSTPEPEIPASFQPPIRERNRKTTPPADPSPPATGPGTGAGALTCAGQGETPCRDVCCPAGTACVGGACQLPIDVQACPPTVPVTCDGAVSCAAGCVANDASGRGNDLTITAPAGFGPGRQGGAVYLNEATGTARIVAPGTDLPQGDRTFEVWVRQDGPGGGWQSVFSYGQYKLSVIRQAVYADQLEFTTCMRTLPADFVEGRWTFIAGTVSAAGTKLYVDGQPVFECLGTNAATGPGGVAIGTGAGYWLEGAVDELRIVDRALTAEEIAADFALAHLPVITGTRMLWRFDEGSPRRCCPAGSSCTADGACEVVSSPPGCPATHPQRCGDGACCPAGTTCGLGLCVHPGGDARCEVDCGDGTCCPFGAQCSGTTCIPNPTIDPANPCSTGQIAAAGPDGNLHCCHDPGGGNAVAYTSQGTCNGCYVASGPGAALESCAAGYAACGGEGKCIRAEEGTAISCGGNATCGGSTTARPGGCCTGGGICAGDGTCCPGGLDGCGGNPCVACSPGTCCSQARCDAGGCAEPKGGCTAPATLCGSFCCPEGTTCNLSDETCRTTSLPFPGCAPGVECGLACCGAGEACVAPDVCVASPVMPPECPAELPVACAGGLGCCPDGFACTGPGGSCEHVDPKPTPSGPVGPRCADTLACATGEVCAGSGCCPADHPVACGASCCLPGAACVDGACRCPGGGAPCGDVCCGSPLSCEAGVCASLCYDGGFPVKCGASCCGPQATCTAGDCLCPSTHPTACEGRCCLSGASCTTGGGGACGCPPSAPTQCGSLCCGPSQLCLQCPGESAPTCRDSPCPVLTCSTPGHSAKTCPGGTQRCCLNDQVCCASWIDGSVGCLAPSFCSI